MYRFLDDRQKVNMVIYFINKDNYDDELKPEKRAYIDTEKIMSKKPAKEYNDYIYTAFCKNLVLV